MADLIYFSIGALGALAFFALTVAVVRRCPAVGIGLICLILVVIWDVPDLPRIFAFSGLSVYPADAVTLVLLVVAILEAPQLQANLQGWLVPWVFFGALIVVSVLRGVATFGPGTAVNEARMILYFFFATTWALAVRPDRIKLHTVSIVIGWVLVVVALYHGVVYGIHGATSAVSVNDDLVQTGRVLVGPQAMVLLLCAGTVSLSPSGPTTAHRRFAVLSSAVFLGLVVLAQHRSVWSACALGMVTVLIWSGRKQARSRVSTLLVMGASLGLVGWASGILDDLGSVFSSASDMRTYEWRTSSWRSLISEAIAKGPEAVVGGQPFGAGYLRQIYTGTWATNTAHNWYVTIFLRLGIIGLITLAAILLAALIKSRSKPAWCTFILVAVAVYGWAYQFDWYLAPWLGAAMSLSLGDGYGRPAKADHAGLGNSNDKVLNAEIVTGGIAP